ncbi:hypothetical protein GCM10022251_82000 [Phytohabitans flavus]|uniref:Uncharacterized protein n=1 Tax=Phytohabitans flavus TaxID=1076124 RepID=A0A6F8XV94_9ACTN|nr:hypothetical protein [Phytohabitans flavus]BCB77719.1 hypothetical protein Pflav_041290 [Phytohabitans flavus]
MRHPKLHGRVGRLRRTVGSALAIGLVTALVVTPAAAQAEQSKPSREARPGKAAVPVTADLEITKTTVDAAGQRHTTREMQRYARDSRGRTRTEAGTRVTLNDPASRTTATLDLAARTVHKVTSGAKAAAADGRAGATQSKLASAPRPLGTRTVQGVPAQGSTYTVAPPPGDPAAGGSEVTVWQSTEVQLPVSLTVVKPSGKEYTQTYTNIRAGVEPDAKLFEVPAGFASAAPSPAAAPTRETAAAAASAGDCPYAANSPLVISSSGPFLGGGVLEAYTGSAILYPNPFSPTPTPCWFIADSAVFESPMDGHPLFPLQLPFDLWDVYDTGGWVPTLPYVAFGYITFQVRPILPFPPARTSQFTTEIILIVT